MVLAKFQLTAKILLHLTAEFRTISNFLLHHLEISILWDSSTLWLVTLLVNFAVPVELTVSLTAILACRLALWELLQILIKMVVLPV